jgi:hypothetical protein
MHEMNAAKLSKSDRLSRVATLLRKARKPLSTMDIISKANVCAVSAIVSELRQNGMAIDCNRVGDVWYYRMVK